MTLIGFVAGVFGFIEATGIAALVLLAYAECDPTSIQTRGIALAVGLMGAGLAVGAARWSHEYRARELP